MKKRIKGKKRKIILIGISVIIMAAAVVFFIATKNNTQRESNVPGGTNAGTNFNSGVPSAGSSPGSQEVKYAPLSQAEIEKVANAILSSEFVKSVPEKDPISLTFFKFENGERIWQDSFLIGKNQLLKEGTPRISLILHSKYISELNGSNLCDIIKQAKKNGDLGSQSDYSTMTLLIKYASLLKYKDCFGI